jgi:iron only hydrogenase large subunit
MSGPLLTGLRSGASLAEPIVTAPSVLILGTDAALAAAPATPVQLVHACQALGYDAVIPASWGDELVASRVIERVRDSDAPLVQCSCPLVAERLAEPGSALGPLLIRLVPPPVAAAEYVRSLYAPVRPTITFVGGCPGATPPSIDVTLSVDALFASLADRGIVVRQQPTEFDSIIPPDRRRFFSEPGGIPSRQALRQLAHGIELVELREPDVVVDLAQQLLQRGRVLIDASLPLGCGCSGRVRGVGTDAARARVREMEPPRSPSPVVDHSVRLSLDSGPLSAAEPSAPHDPPTPRPVALDVGTPTPEDAMPVIESVSRRRSPPSVPRAVLGAVPLARTEAGRSLPRAYVARRRSSPTSVRRIDPVGRFEDTSRTDERRRWVIVATLGVVLGLIAAWVIRVLG